MAISRLNLGTTNQVLVKAAAGQTSNLLELQNSSGTVVAGLNQDGVWSGTAEPGLVLLNTTSFSAVASQSINNCFSASYDVYKINLVFVASTNNTIFSRLRVGGVDNSTASSYSSQYVQGSTSSASAANSLDTAWTITPGSTNRGIVSFDIAQPFVAATTVLTGTGGRVDTVRSIFAHHNQSVSYDGFTFFGDGVSTITGYVQVFGYNK
jgi:hypothetical protein